MAGYGNETNLVEDEYEDDLDGFIVGSDDEGDNVAEGDEYEELPEAEVEEEVEEEYEEEEEEEPSAGQQEIISFREQLKAKLRKQHQSESAGSSSTQPPVKSRFGTFFGPSTPVLAPRLMEAGCTTMMKENQNVPSRKDAASSSASKTQPSPSTHQKKPKIVPQVKRKVDTLRENRDYSNLFSDDVDTPAPTKELTENKPVIVPKSDVGALRMKPTQSAARNNKVPANHPARASKDQGSIQSRVQGKVGSQVKNTLPNGTSATAAVRNGSRPSNGVQRAPGLQPSSSGQNLQRSTQSKSHVQRQQQQQVPKPQGQRQQNLVPPSSQVRKMNSSVQGQQSVQKCSALSQNRTTLGQKQLAPKSKPKPSPTSAVYHDPAKKKGRVKRKLSDAEKVRQMVRDVFNYDPDKYAGRDGDDRNMEAGYASIQMEERRSAKLGRKEDEEQYLLIQEEERRERAKKKKQRPES